MPIHHVQATKAPVMTLYEPDLKRKISQLYTEDPNAFDAIVKELKHTTRDSRPLFPKHKKISDIPRVPDSEVQAFVEKHIDNTAITDYGCDEAKARTEPITKIRDSQYKRWKWACDNFETYVNMLRLSNHSDDNIQAMVDGRPLCLPTQDLMDDLVKGLQEFKPALEREFGWKSVGFVFTGSSVPGFSQNPLKGRAEHPTKITSVDSSDVDICIMGDGVVEFVEGVRKRDLWTRGYTTTCTPTLFGMRFGVDWSILETGVIGDFYNAWNERLPAGLQLTFCESGLEIPPWEMPILLDE